MKIQSLKYEDLSTGWKLDLTEFNPHLTLLVGVSGVGKTQILNALLQLKNMTQGVSINSAIKWKITFKINQDNYVWLGEFESIDAKLKTDSNGFIFVKNNTDKLKIEFEQLRINSDLVVERNESQIKLRNKETVKLSQETSVISLLQDDEFKTINKAFRNIIINHNIKYGDDTHIHAKYISIHNKANIYKTLTDIRNSNETHLEKLYFSHENQRNIFNELKNSFIDIFPFVEDMQVGCDIDFPEIVVIKIKEKGVSNWITQLSFSSGMFKTLMFLVDLYLCPDDSIILIDEFENSLGINCIDEVTSSILASERNLQFIITSHHPYIINNIDTKYWKLVTRNGSVVKAEDAVKYGIGRSKHEAFTQLINLDEYNEGIAS